MILHKTKTLIKNGFSAVLSWQFEDLFLRNSSSPISLQVNSFIIAFEEFLLHCVIFFFLIIFKFFRNETNVKAKWCSSYNEPVCSFYYFVSKM